MSAPRRRGLSPATTCGAHNDRGSLEGPRDQKWTNLGSRVAAGGGRVFAGSRRGCRTLRDEPRAPVHRPGYRLGLRARFPRHRRFAQRPAAEGRALRRQYRRALVLDRRPRDDSGGRLPVQSPGGAPPECSAAAGGRTAAATAHVELAPAAATREPAGTAPTWRLAAAPAAAPVTVARAAGRRGAGALPAEARR